MTLARAGRDRLLAVGLCLILMIGWSVGQWATLGRLWLPDTDDMMRLQQVRDWLGGQPLHDLTQHRLGPSGVPMHWTRVADLLPAGVILLLRPLLGQPSAELVMLVIVPALLFLAYLLAAMRLYRTLDQDGDALAPLVVAALAFPVTGLFQPGRIDHHGLQIILVLLAASALAGRACWKHGAILGLAVATSLVIGVEMLPVLLALAGLAALLWLLRPAEERFRMLGFGGALALGTTVMTLVFSPAVWPVAGCDGFGPVFARGGIGLGAAFLLLGLVGTRVGLAGRGIAGIACAGALAVGLAFFYPQCLADPYGQVDPVVARLWLSQVEEARGLFAIGFNRTTIGHAGLALAGLIAALWIGRRDPAARPALLVIGLGILAALMLMLMQVRGGYAGAALAAAPLALLVNRARMKAPLLVLPAWLVSVGLVYDQLPRMVLPDARARAALPLFNPSCVTPDVLTQLARLPKTSLVAPIDVGAYGIALTPHRFLAAPYHRNNEGNRLMFDLLLGPASNGAATARQAGVAHVLLCHGSLNLPEASLAAALEAGMPVSGFAPVPLKGRDVRLYRVE